MNRNPIGIFDSGLGGLTVLKQVKKLLPHESLIYLGDTARVPYGTRSKDTILRFAREDSAFLSDKNVKMLVIACNTASAYAYDLLKKELDIPIFDVITSTIDESVKRTCSKKISVIGTKATIASQTYQNKLKKACPSCKINTVACPLLVPLIEAGEIEGDLIELVVEKYLLGLRGKQDVLIMGCTHYPIIEKVIKRTLDEDINLIDPGESVAVKIKQFLQSKKLLTDSKAAKYDYYLTDLGPDFKKVAEIFLGSKLEKVNKVELK